MASRIAREIGEHSAYWGLCCGSMAVEMAKTPCPMETVVDLHGDLINLARVVQDPILGPKLYRRLRRVWMHEDVVADAMSDLRIFDAPDAPSVDRAMKYFICAWMGRNGVAGTDTGNMGFCVRFTSNGGAPAKRWSSAIASIPAWRRRMRNFTILRRDIFEVLPRIEDKEGTVIYCDPPYLKKGASYLHDFVETDHDRLAEEAGRFKQTRVVISYYDHPRIADLYPGWTVVDCARSKAMVSQGMRDKSGVVVAPEILLINGPSYTQPSGLFS